MSLYLRNSEKNDVVRVELYQTEEYGYAWVELKSHIYIPFYSEILLKNQQKKDEVIEDFNFLSDLPQWLWEKYKGDLKKQIDEYVQIDYAIRNFLSIVGNKYNLDLIVD